MVPTLTMLGRFSECTRDVIAVPEVPTALVTSASMTLCSCYALPGAANQFRASRSSSDRVACGSGWVQSVVVGPSARGRIISEGRSRVGVVMAAGAGPVDGRAEPGARSGRLGHGPDHGGQREADPDRRLRGGDE